MTTRDHEDWTISRWRVEPRLEGLEPDTAPGIEQAPPLWKDLALAAIVALLLWAGAAAVFG